MKRNTFKFILVLLFIITLGGSSAAQKAVDKKPGSAAFTKTEKEEFDAAIALPPAERIEKLKAFIAAHPRSTLKTRGMELIVSAHAELGDEKLKAGDAQGGIDQFKLAIAEIPPVMSDKLFTEVVSQIPSNLFLRRQGLAALEVARSIEDRVKENGTRLLNLAAFYVGVEAAEDALRVADLVIKQTPDSSPAYQARAAANRIALRLEASADDYAHALQLSPQSASVKRSLAELRRATGKTEEALALYRELLTVDPADEFSRTGLVVALFELGHKEEAEREFENALKVLPNSLALLAGTAYWFAAHNDNPRAVELARKAIEIEPRYIWSYIALSRGLLGQRRPMDAERALLFARAYGRFPTLDYEMASALAAAGLYGEAAATLSSFVLKDGQIETWLAGRTPARSESFTELVAPERRASIFQFTAADSEANAKSLKALLSFTRALNPKEGREAIKESDVLLAAREFVNGDDDMRAFRRLFVSGRLLEFEVALPTALEMMGAVTSEVEPALRTPVATVAVMGEALQDARAQAMMRDSVLNVPDVPRETLSNIMRGRIEELAGWTLFHQGKYADAIVRLRRAVSVLPDKSIWWRNSMWHLGASLEADGKGGEALDVYYKSYKSGGPDTTRRAVIEGLYRRVNGSLEGLDEKIGPSPVVASSKAPPVSPATTLSTNVESTTDKTGTETKPVDVTPKSETITDPNAVSSEGAPSNSIQSSGPVVDSKETGAQTQPVDVTPKTETPTETKSEPSEPQPTDKLPKVEVTSEPKPDPTIAAEAIAGPPVEPIAQATPQPTPEAAPVEVPPGPPQPADNDERHDSPATTATEKKPETKPEVASQRRERRVAPTKCSMTLSESALTIQNNGGRALIEITLDAGTPTDGVTATTSDWSALAVFPEPKSSTNSAVVTFSVTSISKSVGMFTVSVKTPCGSKDVTVTVR